MVAAAAGNHGRESANCAAAGLSSRRTWNPVPTLIRFLVIVGVLVGLVYGGMIALVATVKVQPREMSQTVELPKAPK